MAKQLILAAIASLKEALTKLTGDTEIAFPASAKEINALAKTDVSELCAKIGIETEGTAASTLKQFLLNILAIKSDDGTEIDEDEAVELAQALGLKTKGLKHAKIVTLISEYFAESETDEAAEGESEDDDGEDAEGEDAEGDDEDEAPKKGKKTKKPAEDEDAEGEDEDADEEEEEEAPKKGKKKAAAEDEEAEDEEGESEDDEAEAESEVDFDAIAAEAKLPKEAVMLSRLTAFNEGADEDSQIAVKKGATEKAYRKLLALLVDDSGELSAWDAAYVRAGEGWCCGMPLADKKVKGSKKPHGECPVTGSVFVVDDDNTFSKVESED